MLRKVKFKLSVSLISTLFELLVKLYAIYYSPHFELPLPAIKLFFKYNYPSSDKFIFNIKQ